MRDDLSAPNLGQAKREEYDSQFFWQSYRTIEQWMSRILSKGPIRVSTLAADEITSDTATVGALTVTGSITSPQDTAQDTAIADLNTGKVAKAGDTMTGNLTIAPPSGDAALTIRKSASGAGSDIFGGTGSSTRWLLRLGNVTPESGSNAGSDLSIVRYNDAGAGINTAFSINRASGIVSMPFGATSGGAFSPAANGTLDLGTAALRWRTVYTSDLSLSNGIGDWTIVEGEEDLFLYNNKRGKTYKFNLTEVNPSRVPPKKE